MRALLVALALTSSPVEAQTSISDEDRIRQLESEIELLKRRLDAMERPAAQAATPTGDAPSSRTANASIGSPLSGSSLETPARTDPTRLTVAEMQPPVPPAPLERSLGAQGPGAAFQISASNAASLATIAVTTARTTSEFPDGARGRGSQLALTLGAQAPLNKNGDPTELATLDSLANSFAVKIGITRFIVSLAELGPAELAIEQRAVERCKKDRRVNPDVDCNLDTQRQKIISTYAPEDYDAYLRGGFPGPAFAFGLNGRVGYNKFAFLNPLSGAKEELKRVPWSVGGYVTYLPGVRASSLTAGAEYQRAFEEQSAGVICPAASTTAPFACLTGAVGAPKRVNKFLVSLEGRKLFVTGMDLLPLVGFAPQATIDAKSGKFGVDLPVYLVSNDKGGLLGGVRAGWTNKDGGFVVGVFVGSSFSLFRSTN